MGIAEEVSQMLGQPKGERLEYQAVLPPATTLARIIASFANSKGGFIVLGVADVNGELHTNGLSAEFHATTITHKAIDLLAPKPVVDYSYVGYQEKRLFVIKVGRSATSVLMEGKVYIRVADRSVPKDLRTEKRRSSLPAIKSLVTELTQFRNSLTSAKGRFLDHYLSVLNIVDDLGDLLYPHGSDQTTPNQEGKILMRILFSSCADTFETYASELLYEIYLANPLSLKSAEQVTVKEVLDCADMQEFIDFYAKKKLAKLQRGSVKGFISDNPQIRGLGVFDENLQDGVEKLLQIRHLYSHRNGIVDEKFLRYYPELALNEEHQMSLDEMLNRIRYLAEAVHALDQAAISKYQLASLT